MHTTQKTPSIACNVWVAFWSNSSYSYITVVSFKLTHFSAGLVFQDALNCRDCYVLFVSKLSLICAPCRLWVVMRPRFDFWFWHYIYCLFISHASPLILFSTLFLTYLFWLVNACFCCVRFSFFHTSPRDWLGELSPKWPILCRVGCKTTTQSMNQSLICRSRDTARSVAAYSTCPWFLRSSARLYLPVSSDAGDGRYNIHVTLLLL